MVNKAAWLVDISSLIVKSYWCQLVVTFFWRCASCQLIEVSVGSPFAESDWFFQSHPSLAIFYLEDHPTASNPGDRKSPKDWVILFISYKWVVTPETLTGYDPWDDPPSHPHVCQCPNFIGEKSPDIADSTFCEPT